MKYTPEEITKLESNQIMVFGANCAGRHGLGAAKTAVKKFGAKYGIGRGLQGNSYALPTKDFDIQTLPLFDIGENIKEFLEFAKTRPDLEFFMSKIGCGYAGYTVEEIG